MSDADKPQAESKTMTIRSLEVELQNGAALKMGFNADDPDDDSYFFSFSGPAGLTKLRLSREAFETIIGLKPNVDLHRNVKTEIRFEWVQVKTAEQPVDTVEVQEADAKSD